MDSIKKVYIMNKGQINVLITGAGAPGISGTIYSLKNNYEKRKFKIITTDSKSEVVGKYLSDEFYVIPLASDSEKYLKAIYKLCKDKNIDIIIPQNTAELVILSSNMDIFKNIGIRILLSDKEAIVIANNKYKLMKLCLENNIPVADFYKIDNFNDLIKKAEDLGWPEKKIVIKPPSSNGMRGVRIIDESINLKKMFYEEKPSSLYIKMKNLKQILGSEFPELLIMEYLPGKEYTVDILRNENYSCIIPRKRDLVRSGITFNGSLENNKEIIEYSKIISEKLNLKYCFGFQFKLDDKGIPKILESNPRIQGTMIMSTLSGANIIYSAVKMLLNENVPRLEIDWNSGFYRYWGGVGVSHEHIQYLGF